MNQNIHESNLLSLCLFFSVSLSGGQQREIIISKSDTKVLITDYSPAKDYIVSVISVSGSEQSRPLKGRHKGVCMYFTPFFFLLVLFCFCSGCTGMHTSTYSTAVHSFYLTLHHCTLLLISSPSVSYHFLCSLLNFALRWYNLLFCLVSSPLITTLSSCFHSGPPLSFPLLSPISSCFLKLPLYSSYLLSFPFLSLFSSYFPQFHLLSSHLVSFPFLSFLPVFSPVLSFLLFYSCCLCLLKFPPLSFSLISSPLLPVVLYSTFFWCAILYIFYCILLSSLLSCILSLSICTCAPVWYVKCRTGKGLSINNYVSCVILLTCD